MEDINMVTLTGEIVSVWKGISKNSMPYLILRLKVDGSKPFFVSVLRFGEESSFNKGDRVYVEGRLQESKGSEKYPKTLEILAEFIQIEGDPYFQGKEERLKNMDMEEI